MKARKCLFIDLDGTLLNDRKEISAYSLKALKKWRESGELCVATTGRSLRKFNQVVKEDIFDGYILHNGSLVFYEGKLVFKNQISFASVKDFLKNIKEKNISYGVEVDNCFYANYDGLETGPDSRVYTDQFDRIPKIAADKLIIIGKKFQEYTDLIPKSSYICMLDKNTICITHKNANKLYAAKTLIKMLGISQKNVYVFGNDHNDYELIKGFENSIAVENAIDSVRAVANYITLSNEKNGVAKFIESINKGD